MLRVKECGKSEDLSVIEGIWIETLSGAKASRLPQGLSWRDNLSNCLMRESRWGKVKALQRLLTRSYCGKLLAVKRVTENRGKRTPGIDGKVWSTPAAKIKGSTNVEASRLSTATAKTYLHTLEQWKETSARDTDDARLSDSILVEAHFETRKLETLGTPQRTPSELRFCLQLGGPS